MRSQYATSSLESIDNENINSNYGGRRYFPYAFTESGIAMLSSVLKSEIAINVNIQIMRAFVAMRHTFLSNSHIINRFEQLEFSQIEMRKLISNTENDIQQIFQTLSKYELPKENVFHDNQVYDAHVLMSDLVRRANARIIVIDNYVDDSVLTLLTKRKAGVTAEIYTYKINAQFGLDLSRHNIQYPSVTVHVNKTCHDRFLIIDDKVYHIGASIKDLGQKLCAVILLNFITAEEIISKLC